MKKVTKSREFNAANECSKNESGYSKPEKSFLAKSFNQSADHNKNNDEKESKNEQKQEYKEVPSEDTKPAIKSEKIEKEDEAEPMEMSKKPKLGTGTRFKNLVKELKQKSIQLGIFDSAIVKSLEQIDPNDISEDDINEVEKACGGKNSKEFAEFVSKKQHEKEESKKEEAMEHGGKKGNEEDEEKEEKCESVGKSKNQDNESGCRFKKLVEELKNKSIESGISESEIIKSLEQIDPNEVSEDDMGEIEKAYSAKNPAALAAWIGRKKYGKEKFQQLAAHGKKEKSTISHETKYKLVLEDIIEKSKKINCDDSSIIKSMCMIEIENVSDEDVNELIEAYMGGDSTKIAEWVVKKIQDQSTNVIKQEIAETEVVETEKSKKINTMNDDEKKCMSLPKISKMMNSNSGSGGDLIAPQMGTQKDKRFVKVKKSLDQTRFFV